MPSEQTAIIIGAGPAGLTAAYELLERTAIRPVILEQHGFLGGLSRTAEFKGNRIDIGGHRFFSKSDRVMNWWLDILPLDEQAHSEETIHYQNGSRTIHSNGDGNRNGVHSDRVMLLRPRKSRIFFMRKFFDYPLQLSADTLRKLGLWKTLRIGFSYLRSLLFPIKPEKSLEDFLINRFGRELYHTFFKSYTEKVWGVPCEEIGAEWGAQRIKGLSIRAAIAHFVKQRSGTDASVAQKQTETSLIEQFLYPKYGPGQMWEEVARRVEDQGGEILTHYQVTRIVHQGSRVAAVHARNTKTGAEEVFKGDYFFSTMPVRELIEAWSPAAPSNVQTVGRGLIYRDFITVGVLCRKLGVHDPASPGCTIRDNWIYIQEPDVLVGRLQIFNNWSPFMVADPSKVWIGLEYFCYETDDLWQKSDAELIALAKRELTAIGMASPDDVLDATVIRMPKSYPAYFGSYNRFPEIREYVDQYENLFLIGRNGMHKYNNQDHSMLTAMVAVDNITAGVWSKDNLWEVNAEMDYHESKNADGAGNAPAHRAESKAVSTSY